MQKQKQLLCSDFRMLSISIHLDILYLMYLLPVRFMDKYARLMQKLEIANVEFFKVCFYLISIICHLSLSV